MHRVGRVARAGRSGAAYSLVDTSEGPYLLDLLLYLNKSLTVGRMWIHLTSLYTFFIIYFAADARRADEGGLPFGGFPQSLLDRMSEQIASTFAAEVNYATRWIPLLILSAGFGNAAALDEERDELVQEDAQPGLKRKCQKGENAAKNERPPDTRCLL